MRRTQNPDTRYFPSPEQQTRIEGHSYFGAGDSCDVSDAIWRKYQDGQKVKVEVRARSGKVVCGSL